MEINDVLKRINELAHKKKAGIELTPDELEEKKALYGLYLNYIKGQFKQQLDRIEFVDEPAGTSTQGRPTKTIKHS